MKKTAALTAILLFSVAARAIELSLEENRGERGSVGYVDMQRLFANSPDAQRAKEGFEDLVRQAEERVNLRKAELLKLRQELDDTRAKRDTLAQTMAQAPAPTPPPAVVAISTPVIPTVAVSTTPSPASTTILVSTSLPLPGMAPPPTVSSVAAPARLTPPLAISTTSAVAVSSAAAAPSSPPKLALPGMSNVPVIASTAAAAAAASLFPSATNTSPIVQVPAAPTPTQHLLELDAKIIAIQADITHKEFDLTHEHDDADRGLLDVESRKTDQVLARLYRAVSEVARREGVSVVIDKTSILYGHQAVDLTDKVLKYLRETPAP